MSNTTRRKFLASVAAFSPALILPSATGKGFPLPAADPLPDAVVQGFVGAAHRDLEQVKSLLTEYPHILNAAWDWGDGDFETALGAAGHVGRRDIALFLLEKGARADIFVLTMLGETEMVKPVLEKYPHLLQSLGPHGFTLLHHAQRGGEQAKELLAYLTEKGLTETRVMIYNK